MWTTLPITLITTTHVLYIVPLLIENRSGRALIEGHLILARMRAKITADLSERLDSLIQIKKTFLSMQQGEHST